MLVFWPPMLLSTIGLLEERLETSDDRRLEWCSLAQLVLDIPVLAMSLNCLGYLMILAKTD